MNLVDARIENGRARFAGFDVPVADATGVGSEPRDVILGIRPTDFELGPAADPSWPRLSVKAEVVEDLGAELHVIFGIDARAVSAEAVRAAVEAADDDEGKLLADDTRAIFTARVAARQPVRVGEQVELALDPGRLHFFDPQDGVALAAAPGMTFVTANP
jgi:multiple sugar transport system ATP-binding protein